MLAIEANDEWPVGRGYMAQHTMDALLSTTSVEKTISLTTNKEAELIAA